MAQWQTESLSGMKNGSLGALLFSPVNSACVWGPAAAHRDLSHLDQLSLCHCLLALKMSILLGDRVSGSRTTAWVFVCKICIVKMPCLP